MLIAETCRFEIGRFTVQSRPRLDNPAFAQYLIYLGEMLIGKQFSYPQESDCVFLERQRDAAALIYAQPRPQIRTGFTMLAISRRGRPSNAERARRAALLAGVPEEIT